MVACTTASSQSMFTVIDDDISSIKAIQSVKRVADKKNIKISFAATVNRLLKSREIVDTLLKYQAEGHHICNHGLTHSEQVWGHPCWDDIKEEVAKAKSTLDSLGFKDNDYLVYPFGKYGKRQRESLEKSVPKMFRLAFNSRGHFNDLDHFNRYYIERLPVRKFNSISAVEFYIDKACEANGWIVLMNHSGKSRDYKPEFLEKIIDICLEMGMKPVTVDQAYNILKERGVIDDDNKSLAPTQDYGLAFEIQDNIFLNWHYSILAFATIIATTILIINKRRRKQKG